jgi:hypothetical protein
MPLPSSWASLLLLQLDQGAQFQLHGFPFAAGATGLHRLLHQGVVDDDVGAAGADQR